MPCWAVILGDCGGRKSQEHWLTKALYEEIVRVTGPPWTQDGEEVRLPIKALHGGFLCQHHNNALSPADAEAVRCHRFLSRAVAEIKDQTLSPAIPHERVDGELIIRWLCKTTCNLETLYKRAAPEALVRRAFGAPGGGAVRVYFNSGKATPEERDISHFQWRRWDAQVPGVGATQVYAVRFSVKEWVLTSFPLTQRIREDFATATEGRYVLGAREVTQERLIWVNDGRRETHLLEMKFHRKRRR